MSAAIPPNVLSDPRFKAARKLMKTGRVTEGPVEIFATLLEECINKYSDSSLEAATCFYEYGNALFRAVGNQSESISEDRQSDSLSEPEKPREVAANAAQARLASKAKNKDTEVTTDLTNGTHISDQGNLKRASYLEVEKEAENVSIEEVAGSEEQESSNQIENQSTVDDCTLALEMMENAYSIFEEKLNQNPDNDWILHQLPRTLQGIGDVLRELPSKKADAADAYSRALPYLEEFVNRHSKDSLELNALQDRRLLAEGNVLVADALLECEAEKDVVTSETKDILVKADERVDFARGYYDKARDELQEAVFLMGRIAATGADLGTHKEDMCFAATLLMGVGEALAAYDEETAASSNTENEAIKPVAKKPKTK